MEKEKQVVVPGTRTVSQQPFMVSSDVRGCAVRNSQDMHLLSTEQHGKTGNQQHRLEVGWRAGGRGRSERGCQQQQQRGKNVLDRPTLRAFSEELRGARTAFVCMEVRGAGVCILLTTAV